MQSRLFAIFLAVVLLVAMVHFMPKQLHRQLNLDEATCQVFCQQTTLAHADVGFGKIVNCNGGEIVQTLSQCKQVDGLTVRLQCGKSQLNSILQQLDVTVHTTQTLGNLTVICGYSPKIVGYIYLDGQRTNVQIAFDGNTVTVGSPLILGDY